MASSMLPPNPSLVAVILVIKTSTGPRQVFHYPPKPGKNNSQIRLDLEHSSDEDSISSSNPENSSLEDEELSDGERVEFRYQKGRVEPDIDESGSISPEKNDGAAWERSKPRQNDFLGLPVGLEHLLCPPRSSHKSKFEISIDRLTFLGWPVFARENGEWQRRKKKKKQKQKVEENARNILQDKVNQNGQRLGSESRRMSLQVEEGDPSQTSGDDSAIEGLQVTAWDETVAAALEDTGIWAEEDRGKETLNMFHTVFVMDPPPLEHQLRVLDMYKHVVQKFSRALRFEQAQSGYVLREAGRIRDLEAKEDSSPHQIIQSSSLAKAIATLYTSISTSRIAHLYLTPALSISLQIPILTSISVLPTPTSPQLPGVWITTATSLATDDDVSTPSTELASHFALLLLSELPSILADVTATASPLTAPLTAYLRVSTPTKSFLQISQSSGIPLPHIQFLASHLIYWRRARAIPPLHQRDTYIVSPNCDMRKLRSACTTYTNYFPALPSLPKILSLLSTTPRSFTTLIPSKDHKPAYLEILAWLMRGGWVTQLRTFAWVRVTSEIQQTVAAEIEREERGEAASSSQHHKSEAAEANEGTVVDVNGSGAEDAGDPDRPSSGHLSPPHSAHSTKSSTSSARTAIPSWFFPPNTLSSPSDPSQSDPLIILNPTRPSSLESRYLSAIAVAMGEAHGEEVRRCWEKCLKYFNGRHALEKIAVREGWKRKRVGELMGVWRGSGGLMVWRGW